MGVMRLGRYTLICSLLRGESIGRLRSKEASTSFLKKRSKKHLLPWHAASGNTAPRKT
jgi:hypothetical protein